MIRISKSFSFDGYLDRLQSYLKTYNFNHDEIIEEFESKICEYTEAKYCIAINSATSGILMVLAAIMGDTRTEVLISSYGYPAAYRACNFLGLNPIMIDMEMETLGMNPDILEKHISRNTLAVVNVETNGMIGQLDRIKSICHEKGVFLLEDSAPSMTQKYDGKIVGTHGDAGVYSFAPTKVLNSGEGGAIVTNDRTFADKLKALRYNPDFSCFWPISLNFSMSPFLAAILIPQFNAIEKLRKQRESVHNLYKKNGLDIFENPRVTNSYPYAIYKTPFAKQLKEKLDRLRIGNVYRGYAVTPNCPGAIEMDTEIIFLPKLNDMTEDQIKSVCTIAKRF